MKKSAAQLSLMQEEMKLEEDGNDFDWQSRFYELEYQIDIAIGKPMGQILEKYYEKLKSLDSQIEEIEKYLESQPIKNTIEDSDSYFDDLDLTIKERLAVRRVLRHKTLHGEKE